MNDSNYTGNISTIVKYVSMMIAGYTISLLASKGLNLPIDETMLSQIIGAIIGLILAHIDATHPNNFKILGNENTCTCQQDTTGEIPDVDPASEYENQGGDDGGA